MYLFVCVSFLGSQGDDSSRTEARRFAADKVDGVPEEKGQRSFGVRKSRYGEVKTRASSESD